MAFGDGIEQVSRYSRSALCRAIAFKTLNTCSNLSDGHEPPALPTEGPNRASHLILCCSSRCSPMAPLFPFTNPKCHFMQRAVVSFIESPKFFFRLPALTNRSWTLVNNPSAERERLEFLGDALIGSCISEELFRCRPHEGPGFYTVSYTIFIRFPFRFLNHLI